jgi:ubiquinone/menaquinone biosynthesis C-methylase UbiE
MPRPPRVNYDQIAPLYDSQPYRSRAVDPQFLVYRRDRGTKTPLAVLDIACGTGNQLIANRAAAMDAHMVGVDRSLGMLRQARAKAPEIAWVQADSAALPFPARSFDFVGCQFAFHHFPDKAGMLHEVFRALRPGGRFVLRNLCPEESNDWLYYWYFPEALVVDLLDFWPADAIAAVTRGIGFAPVNDEFEHLRFEVDLGEWLNIVRRRDSCSQLQAIDDAAYEAGVQRLARDVAALTRRLVRADHLCMLTIRGDKPAGN